MLNCSYSNPVDFSGAPASASSTPFAFASSSCAYVQDASTTIKNSFSYGELNLILFDILVFFTLAFGVFWFFIKQVKIKRK